MLPLLLPPGAASLCAWHTAGRQQADLHRWSTRCMQQAGARLHFQLELIPLLLLLGAAFLCAWHRSGSPQVDLKHKMAAMSCCNPKEAGEVGRAADLPHSAQQVWHKLHTELETGAVKSFTCSSSPAAGSPAAAAMYTPPPVGDPFIAATVGEATGDSPSAPLRGWLLRGLPPASPLLLPAAGLPGLMLESCLAKRCEAACSAF